MPTNVDNSQESGMVIIKQYLYTTRHVAIVCAHEYILYPLPDDLRSIYVHKILNYSIFHKVHWLLSPMFVIWYVCRLDKKLKEIEIKYHIRSRWASSDPVYIEVKSKFTKEHIRQLAEAMWSASSRRLFLLQLKAKYAGKHPVTRQHSVLSNNMSIIIDYLFCIFFLLFVCLCCYFSFQMGKKLQKN